MADLGLRQWKDLPPDLLLKIGRHLPCIVDRFYMSWTCHDWWFAIQLPPPPRQLPWLLLPDPTIVPLHILPRPDSTRRVSFYCLLGNGDTHNLRIRHDTGGARFFGSYDGGWLLLSHGQTNRHMLLNLHTDQRLFLPDYVLDVAHLGGDIGPPAPIPIAILAATFSSPPAPTMQCFGAAIIDSPHDIRCPQLAFWCMKGAGDRRPVAMGFMENFGYPGLRLEDVIHHRGAFHFLTDGEHLFVYDISNFQEDEEGIRYEVGVNELYFLRGPPRSSSLSVAARYLVESRGELLMVVRLVRYYPERVRRTEAFQVYRVTEHLTGAGLVHLTWTELSSLDGRMIFAARGCSRSYEVADFPGFGFGEGIYFLDDRNSIDVVVVSQHGILAEYTSTRNGWVEPELLRRYPCSDNGMCRWVEGEPRLQVFRHWFTNKEPSNCSPPIWFIP